MVRWQPGAKQRLQAAALDLYVSRGFEQTTTADIAESVGLTERTFFRYFTDKREVLFDGQDQLVQAFVDGVATALPDSSPLAKVTAALEVSAAYFADTRRAYARRRQIVIDAHPALRERELLKMGSLAGSIAAALRETGVAEPVATLTAETCVTVFKVAFVQWIAEGEDRPLALIERAVMQDMQRTWVDEVTDTLSMPAAP